MWIRTTLGSSSGVRAGRMCPPIRIAIESQTVADYPASKKPKPEVGPEITRCPVFGALIQSPACCHVCTPRRWRVLRRSFNEH